MVNWKDNIKKIGIKTGKGIVEGAKIVASEVDKRAKVYSWKSQILNRMYDGNIRKLAYDKGIKPYTFDGSEPTIDDYREAIMSKVSLKELIEFCERKRIPIRDIKNIIDREATKEELEKISENPHLENVFKEVVTSIHNFKQSKDYTYELPYQAELIGWLKQKFPSALIEEPRGASRPDITIGGIAIEVKGPTGARELESIANKCMRYSEHFKEGLILVLFKVEVNQFYYDEWLESLKKTFSHVIVIRK